MQVAQLRGDISQAETTVWNVDFSRHTIVKSDQISHIVDQYDSEGQLTMRMNYDTDNQLDSKVIYQYTEEGHKRVSTTYSKTGNRTLQTLYAYTADGYLARMRFTDADAVTISTTEVGVTKSEAITLEMYNDSEKVRTTYSYDTNLNIIGIVRNDGNTKIETRYALAYNGLAARGTQTSSTGEKHTLTFEHEVDEHGNWTRKVTYIDGVATEVTERVITYKDK